MSENQTQLSADEQHQVETFGALIPVKPIAPPSDIIRARHFDTQCNCYGCVSARVVLGHE